MLIKSGMFTVSNMCYVMNTPANLSKLKFGTKVAHEGQGQGHTLGPWLGSMGWRHRKLLGFGTFRHVENDILRHEIIYFLMPKFTKPGYENSNAAQELTQFKLYGSFSRLMV